jgi:DNA-directed RNA polymerase subunit RPC12/RpoP
VKVDYKSLFYEGSDCERSYGIIKTEYCCERLEKVLTDKRYLSGLDIIRQSFDERINEDEVKVAMFLMEYDVDSQFMDTGYEINETSYKIDYCPFCGSKIVFNEVKKVKVIKHVKKVPRTICEEHITEEEIELT